MRTVTVPRLSGSSTSVIVRLVSAGVTAVASAAAVAVGTEEPSAVASLCTVSITCCMGDRVGLGVSCVSTVTDFMTGVKAVLGAASFWDVADASNDPGAGAASLPSVPKALVEKAEADAVWAAAADEVNGPPAAIDGVAAAVSLDVFVASGKAPAEA